MAASPLVRLAFCALLAAGLSRPALAQDFVLRGDAFGSAGGASSGGPHGLGFSAGLTLAGRSEANDDVETAVFWRHAAAGAVGVIPADSRAAAFRLEPGLPNPFTTSTTLRFAIPVRDEVRLDVVDLSGRVVRRLLARSLPAGTHTVAWDGTTDAGSSAPSGLYFCRLRAGGMLTSRRLARFR